ncbi:uncharacterized protein LOC103316396 [Nasonia vitripennis]|uniref:Uncharacterized protein n=1 Tax=Nasonia vitripennis TaxID=7425 RepID=A0A7M7H4R3_NASVI|nr:uncharacterized protein LOC103316396 [Nasonia vitripennis]
MSEPERREIAEEKFLSKIYNYILESPDLDLLRRLFVPSIDRRVQALLEHFVYRDHEDTPKRLFGGVDAWLEASERLLRVDGLAGVLVDSVLMSNRLDHIGREIDEIGFGRPRLGFGLTRGCERLEQWIARCQSTFLGRTPPEATTSVSPTPTRQCSTRKRKASNCHEALPPESNPFDACPSSLGDQTKSRSRASTKLRRATTVSASRSDKLKVVVTEVCRDGGTRRSDYLKLPCDSKALREKVFGKGNFPTSNGRLDERLQSVCVCLNNVTQRMQANDASLSCDIRKNYVRFKLGRVKSRLCAFASRVALGRPRGRRSTCGGGRDYSDANVRFCKEVEDEEPLSETDQSTKYLWCKDGEEFVASSLEGEDDDSFDEDEILSSTRIDAREDCGSQSRREKEQENSVSVKGKVAAEACACKNENILRELGLACDEVGSTKVNEKNGSDSVQKDLKDTGVMTEEIQESSVVLKNAETCTGDTDDSVELTNVYINEISLCYCDEKEETTKHCIGVNTECRLSAFANTGTNTDCAKFRETWTQVFFKEIHFCACDKQVDQEFEIKSIKFEDRDADHSCKCNKETSTDDKYTLIELDCAIPRDYEEVCEKMSYSPRKKSECADGMRTKINEIVDLNEKIREKFRVLKGSKDLCSVSVQTLCKRSCSSRNIEIQVRTSVTSLKSNSNIKCATKTLEREESTATQCTKVCDNSVCQFKNEDSTLRRSILTEVAASLDDPTLRKLRDNLNACEVIHESFVTSKKSTSSRCDSRFAQGDAVQLHSRSFIRLEHKVQRTCRCSKKNHFLNFLSEHLTRESFERCKSLLRSILRKLLEKVKALNELRKPTCRRAGCCATCHHEPSRHERTTCGTRLAAGASDGYVSRWSIKEFSRANEFTRACRDFENRRGRQLVRREPTRRRSSEWEHVSSERCRRIEAFTSAWRDGTDPL